MTTASGGRRTDATTSHAADPTRDRAGRHSCRLQQARQRNDRAVAVVAGRMYREVPADLYIPPDALEVFLDTFEGPMDLLLYLIRRRNIDILDIPVAKITEQYMRHIELMEVLQLGVAGEYLVMAATLAEMKSRMILQQQGPENEEEDDPRAKLMRRLREYELLKEAAVRLDELPRLERDLHTAHAAKPEPVARHAHPDVDLKEVLAALGEVLARAAWHRRHAVVREGLSVRERMSDVLARVNERPGRIPFASLFDPGEGRSGVVVTFLALMELLRDALIDLVQNGPFAPIYVCAPQAGSNAEVETGAETARDAR